MLLTARFFEITFLYHVKGKGKRQQQQINGGDCV